MKLLRTIQVPLEELSPYPDNARNGDTDVIAASLRAHGQYRALVVRDADRTVLAGNHTLHALHETGAKKALVHLIECDDGEALQINLIDNRANDLAGYDNQQLANLLQSLDGDFTGTGYDQDALDGLLERISQEESAALGDQQESELVCPSCGHTAPSGKFKP